MVAGQVPILPKSVVRVRPVGVLIMEDEAGQDEKILTVPVDKLHPYYTDVGSWRDLPKILIDQIQHFFTHYKDLEANKWVKVRRWGDAEEALDLIRAGIRAAEAKPAKAAE
jgi:inorganic pyrophosphatase